MTYRPYSYGNSSQVIFRSFLPQQVAIPGTKILLTWAAHAHAFSSYMKTSSQCGKTGYHRKGREVKMSAIFPRSFPPLQTSATQDKKYLARAAYLENKGYILEAWLSYLLLSFDETYQNKTRGTSCET